MEENKSENISDKDDDKHKNHHFWQKRHEKEKEIATKRGEATAYATVGTLGTVGWGAAELAADVLETSVELGASKISKKTWKNIGFVAGVAAIGGFIYAGIKHLHAEKLQDELNDKDAASGPQL